jgi:hypothetical protein
VADLLNLLAMYSKGRPTPAPLLAAGQKLPRQLLEAARNLAPGQHQRCAGRLLWAAWQVMSAQQQWGAVEAVPGLSHAVQSWVGAQGLHLGLEEPVCLLAALGLLLHLASTGAVAISLEEVQAMGLQEVAVQAVYPGRDQQASQTLARLHRQLLQLLIWALLGAGSSAELKAVSLRALRAFQEGLRHQLQVRGWCGAVLVLVWCCAVLVLCWCWCCAGVVLCCAVLCWCGAVLVWCWYGAVLVWCCAGVVLVLVLVWCWCWCGAAAGGACGQ